MWSNDDFISCQVHLIYSLSQIRIRQFLAYLSCLLFRSSWRRPLWGSRTLSRILIMSKISFLINQGTEIWNKTMLRNRNVPFSILWSLKGFIMNSLISWKNSKVNRRTPQELSAEWPRNDFHLNWFQSYFGKVSNDNIENLISYFKVIQIWLLVSIHFFLKDMKSMNPIFEIRRRLTI